MLERLLRWFRSRFPGATSKATGTKSGENPTILVRAVDLALWTETTEGFAEGEVPATIVQHKDFKATANTLSFWRFNSTDDVWMKDAVLAVVGGLNRLDGIHLVWLRDDEIRSDIGMAKTQGKTCFPCFVDCHVDAEKLDGRRLAAVAETVAAALSQQVITKTREEVIDILVEAVTARKLLKVDNLPKGLKDAVRERLGAQPS